MMDSEIRVIYLQAKEYQNIGEGYGTDSPSEPSEGTNPAHNLTSDF